MRQQLRGASQRLVVLLLPLVVELGALGCSDRLVDDPYDESKTAVTLTPEQTATLPVVGEDARDSPLEVVFQAVRVLDGDLRVVSSEQQGTLRLADWQRAARPGTYSQ